METPSLLRFERSLVMGDPQAPFAVVMAILERHQLLGGDGKLRPEVQLLSIGDHFDWNGDLDTVARDGVALLRWLASHSRQQVVILCGNHDLARVTELWRQDDVTFARARRLGEAIRDAAGDEKAALE